MAESSGVFDPYLEKWWADRSPEERAALIEAAEADDYPLSEETFRLLRDTGCPVGPVGTRWDMQPDYAWSWSPDVQAFILDQRGQL